MPSIVVAAADAPAGTVSTGGPVIGGVSFRRPKSRTTTFDPVRTGTVIANGETRTYDNGIRRVVALSWGRMTETELAQLAAVCKAPFVTYADDPDDPVEVMDTDEGVSSEAVAGTFPIRHAVSVTLKARKPVR